MWYRLLDDDEGDEMFYEQVTGDDQGDHRVNRATANSCEQMLAKRPLVDHNNNNECEPSNLEDCTLIRVPWKPSLFTCFAQFVSFFLAQCPSSSL